MRNIISEVVSIETQTKRQSLSALCCGKAALYVLLLLLTAQCSLLTALAQPGMPQPNSPLYGARPGSGPVSSGLPPVLKNVRIDQRLNEQVPLDAVFKDEQGRDVNLGQFFKGKPVVLSLVYYTCPMLCNQVLNECWALSGRCPSISANSMKW